MGRILSDITQFCAGVKLYIKPKGGRIPRRGEVRKGEAGVLVLLHCAV
jgi:hypothetical protein